VVELGGVEDKNADVVLGVGVVQEGVLLEGLLKLLVTAVEEGWLVSILPGP